MNVNTSARKNFIKEIKNINTPIVIFGCGFVGKLILKLCRENSISIAYFCDNSQNKIGNEIEDINVVSLGQIVKNIPSATFIIATSSVNDIIEQLKDNSFETFFVGDLFFDEETINKFVRNNYERYILETYINCARGYLNSKILFVKSVDLIITERCSLKCKDCSNLMQYYENPQDCTTNDLLKQIERFCDLVDEINEVRIIGGEPFMNKDIHVIIEKLLKISNVNFINIYTNATILPNEKQIEILKNKKIVFSITDYGELSRNIQGLESILQRLNIIYKIDKIAKWIDCAKIQKHNRNRDELVEIFKKCCVKHILTISEGKLFRCPFSANSYRLNAVIKSNSDYIDFMNTRKNIVEDLKLFISGCEYMNVCDFCNGRDLSAEANIEPAVQVENSLTFQKYQ